MAEPKTRPTDASVDEFLGALEPDRRRVDAQTVDEMMRTITGETPVMWGTSMVGYGSAESAGARNKKGTWPVIAFSPRKAELVLYLNTAIDPAAFDGLGPHRRGVGCLYLKRLDQLDLAVLHRIIEHSVRLSSA